LSTIAWGNAVPLLCCPVIGKLAAIVATGRTAYAASTLTGIAAGGIIEGRFEFPLSANNISV
jgi:hypothetical protein